MRTKADRILDKLPSDEGVDQESLVRMVSEHFETFSELVDAVREVHYKKVEDNHAPRAFGYRRVSTADQARDGFSLESQKKTVEKYFALLKDRVAIPSGELQWGGVLRGCRGICIQKGTKNAHAGECHVPYAESGRSHHLLPARSGI